MENKKALIKLKNVSKFYYNKGNVASGFNKINLEFFSGEFVVITGESGSGKSTLLNVIAGLDSYEEGEMYINGNETSHYIQKDFEHYRKTYIGNIFQSFNLVNSYTVYQNIELVLLLNGFKKKDIKEKVIDLIKKVDLYKYRNTRVSHLSGGQKQRVAIARALAKDTPIILADEPTGNLDSKSAASVLKLLSEIAKDKLVIVVTHNYDQVEKYATRKIEMHDGKVREDIILKEDKITDVHICEYKDIDFFNKIRIGIRNTFNIIPKFLLTFLVFIFVIISFLGTYSSFRKAEHQEQLNSMYMYYFLNTDAKRIVINKKDKSSFTAEEINNIKNMNHVDKVYENDIFLDISYYLSDNDYKYYFYGPMKEISELDKVDIGRIPKNDNEVVIKVNKDDYYVNYEYDGVINTKFRLASNEGVVITDDIIIVGVVYTDSYNENCIYVNENVINNAKILVNQTFSTLNAKFDEIDYQGIQIIATDKLKSGEAYVSNEFNSYCSYAWCRNKKVSLNVSNIYYTDVVNLTIKDVFYKSTIKNYTGYSDYEYYSYSLFISKEDYNYLFNRNTYQLSIFADDDRNVDTITDSLNSDVYNYVELKYASGNGDSSLVAAIKVVKTVVIVVLFIVLFFITYFVIKLIQKSKNIYYSTVRILGASSKIIKSFIRIELFTIYNLTYILSMLFILLIKYQVIKIEYFNNMITYLYLKDYIFIYIILLIMSYLIANRYAHKLFKSSAMKAYREEI